MIQQRLRNSGSAERRLNRLDIESCPNDTAIYNTLQSDATLPELTAITLRTGPLPFRPRHVVGIGRSHERRLNIRNAME